MPSRRRAAVLVWALIAVAVLVFARAPAVSAQAECEAVDMDEIPRACTFLERHGQCLWNSLDSYDRCVEDSQWIWERAGCEIAVQVDLLACNFALPWRFLEEFRR